MPQSEVSKILSNPDTGEKIVPAASVAYMDPVRMGQMMVSIAPIWKDPKSEANSMFVKLTKGADPRHLHPEPFLLVVIEGQIIHATDGIDGAKELLLGPGSYFYQPADVAHQDICVTDEALVFCALMGKSETTWLED
jgi:quercetin dioxygenase-like cupin family protein